MQYKDGKHCFIYVQHEHDRIESGSLELISKAYELLKDTPEHVVAVVLGNLDAQQLATLKHHGAKQIIHCETDALTRYDCLKHTTAITEIIETFHPQSFLFPGTIRGRELAPRISARVSTGLTADATHLELDNAPGETHSLAITRPAFGGNLYATIITPDHVPQMATIRPGVFEKATVNTLESSITPHTIKSSLSSPIEVESIIPNDTQKSLITDAKVIVSAGRGVKDCLDLIKTLTVALNAELGASRAMIDDGLIDKPSQVGQTGATVRPNLYFACGISGALQHTAGMDKSDTIIAINNDPSAPIFDVADIGIIGDAKDILHELNTTLSAQKAN